MRGERALTRTSEGTAPATVAQQLRIHSCSIKRPYPCLTPAHPPTRALLGLPARARMGDCPGCQPPAAARAAPLLCTPYPGSLCSPGSYARIARTLAWRTSFWAHAAALCCDPRACLPAMPAAAQATATSAQPTLGHPASLTKKECQPAAPIRMKERMCASAPTRVTGPVRVQGRAMRCMCRQRQGAPLSCPDSGLKHMQARRPQAALGCQTSSGGSPLPHGAQTGRTQAAPAAAARAAGYI